MEHLRALLREIMKNTNDFVVEISSNLDYEDIIANILYKEESVAIISQENGLENFEIEIFPPVETKSWMFLLEEFINALQLGKKLLIKMQKKTE